MKVDRMRLEAATRAVAQTIDSEVPDMVGSMSRIGFVVMLFEFGEGGFLAYASNANRDDMIKTVKEWLARAESGLMTDPPGARAKT